MEIAEATLITELEDRVSNLEQQIVDLKASIGSTPDEKVDEFLESLPENDKTRMATYDGTPPKTLSLQDFSDVE